MAALSYNITEFLDQGDKREYVQDGHTSILQQRITFTRQRAGQNKPVQEYRFVVYHNAIDGDSVVLPQPITLEAKLRFPVLATTSGVTAAVTAAQLMLISDEYVAGYQTGKWPA
jgi:hypothetical protein